MELLLCTESLGILNFPLIAQYDGELGYVGRGTEVERISQEGFLWGLGGDPGLFPARGSPLGLAGSLFLYFNLDK